MQRVANALVRKYNWKIFPEGNVALNYLGLSTQVVTKHIYISSGSPRKYKIGNRTLEFRHRLLTENAMLVVQAVKSLGQIHAGEPDFIQRLSQCFSYAEWVGIEKNSYKVADWILSVIKKAKEIAKNE